MKKNLLITLFLIFVTLIYFAPVIFSSNTFIARDNYTFYNPRHFFAAETVKAGGIPLWNPYLACGVPFQANVQSSIFYPFSAIYYILPFQQGYKYYIVLHYFLGSFFMFFLMREWGSSRYAAFVSGIVFAFGGYMGSILDNVAFLTAAVWLPLIVLCFHRTLKTGSFFYALFTAIVIAVQIFAGDASFYIITSILCMLLYALFWPVTRKNFPTHKSMGAATPWLLLLSSVGIGLLLAAIQLVPMVELVSHSTRFEGLSYDRVTKWSYHPLEFLQLFAPYIFGSTVPLKRWFGQLWLDTFYLGIWPLTCALFFIVYGKKNIKYFSISLLLISFFLAIGKHNPLFIYLYQFVPGLGMLQYPVKFLFPALFSLSIMAGWGASAIFDSFENSGSVRQYTKWLWYIFILLTAACLSALAFKEETYGYFQAIYPQTTYLLQIEKESFLFIFRGLAYTMAFIALIAIVMGAGLKGRISKSFCMYLVVGITIVDLVFIGKPEDPLLPESLFERKNMTTEFFKQDSSLYRIYSLPSITGKSKFMHLYNLPFEGVYRSLQEVMRPNLNMYYQISSANEYADILNINYYKIFSPVQIFFRNKTPLLAEKNYRDKILDLLNVKYLLSFTPLDGSRYKLVKDGVVKIYENPDALPRAFFVEKLLQVKSEAEVLRRMQLPSFDPAKMVYVSEKEAQKLTGEFIPAAASNLQNEPFYGTIEFIDYQPNFISLKARSNQPRFLLLSDNYYPGWKAFVNGKEKPVLKVDHTLKGLLLEKGENYIRFVFSPLSFRLGAAISLLVLAGVVLGLIGLRKQKRTSYSEQPSP